MKLKVMPAGQPSPDQGIVVFTKYLMRKVFSKIPEKSPLRKFASHHLCIYFTYCYANLWEVHLYFDKEISNSSSLESLPVNKTTSSWGRNLNTWNTDI